MYKIQVSYHHKPFDDYPSMPYRDKTLAKEELAKRIKNSAERYADLEARWRLVEISEEQGQEFQKEVCRWHAMQD